MTGVVAKILPIRPRISETFICPCGSHWFSRSHRFAKDGRCIESADYMKCDGCDRRHKVKPKVTP